MQLSYTCGFRDSEALFNCLQESSLNSNSSNSSTSSSSSLLMMDSSNDMEPGRPKTEETTAVIKQETVEEEPQRTKRKREEDDEVDAVPPIPKRARVDETVATADDQKKKKKEEDNEPDSSETIYKRITCGFGIMNGYMKNQDVVRMHQMWNEIEEEFRKEVHVHRKGLQQELFVIRRRRIAQDIENCETARDIHITGNYVRAAAAVIQLIVDYYRKKDPRILKAIEVPIDRFVEKPSLTALRLLGIEVRSALLRTYKQKPHIVFDVESYFTWPTYTSPAAIVRAVQWNTV